MSIPDFQSLMLPILQLLADGKDHAMRDVTSAIISQLGLTAEEIAEKLPSGQQTVIGNRIAWAKAHLKMAELVQSPSRGIVRITKTGETLLKQKPERIDLRLLKTYPAYLKNVTGPERTNGPPVNGPVVHGTPKEQIESAYLELKTTLAREILDKIKASSPAFFEELVVRLLVGMGYGGSLADAGQRLGRPGDGGIDGIIKEDRLGLDLVCIQAKRWESTVGRPVVQGFVGSMDFHRSRKGVLITTSGFSADAQDYIQRIEGKKVVLIDGSTLAELMIEFNIGVSVAETYQLKKIDHDFFSEDPE